MDKFIKFLKIFLLCFAALLGVTLVVCYIIYPTETKNVVDIVIDYVNRPLPIVGISILTIGGLVLTIISKTSFGKRQLNNLRGEIGQLRNDYDQYKQGAEQYYDLALKEKEEQKAILSAYTSEIDNLTDNLIKACETSPNAKIRAIANEIKNKTTEIKSSLNEELSKIDANVNDYIAEKVDVEKLQEKILGLEELVKGLGVQNGEETIDR